jgi:hydrogenase maturation protein HypF
LRESIKGKINSPYTSSGGRLFDAVSSLLGICQVARFEGEGAMKLEFVVGEQCTEASYDFDINKQPDNVFIVDWERIICAILKDIENNVQIPIMSTKFHNTLANIIVQFAKIIGLERVVLSGGCFMNKYLVEKAYNSLTASGFHAYIHQRVPTNDGGIALGQVFASVLLMERKDVSGGSGEDNQH